MTRAFALARAAKLIAMRDDRAASKTERETASRALDHLVKSFNLAPADLASETLLEQTIANLRTERGQPRGPDVGAVASVLEQPLYPGRVHIARDYMRAVCGVGPSFVWTRSRDVAIASGQPCPYCLDTRILDAFKPEQLAPQDAASLVAAARE